MVLPVRLLLITSGLILASIFLSPDTALSNHPPPTPVPPGSERIEITRMSQTTTQANFGIEANYNMSPTNKPKMWVYRGNCGNQGLTLVNGEEINVGDHDRTSGTYIWRNLDTISPGTDFVAILKDRNNEDCFEGTVEGLTSTTLSHGDGQGLNLMVFFRLESNSIDWNNPPTIQVWDRTGCTGDILKNERFERISDTTGRYTWDLGSYQNPSHTGPYSAQSSNPTSNCDSDTSTPDPPIPGQRPQSPNCPELIEINPEDPRQGEPIEFIFEPDDTLGIDKYELIIAGEGGVREFTEKDGKWVITYTPARSGVFQIKLHVEDGGQCVISNNFAIAEPYGEGFGEDDLTGWLPQRVQKVVNSFLSFGLGIAGGIAFLLLIYGSFRFIFSAGDPKAVAAGREIITAAVIGLLVIIFSVFLLRLIGISILGIPI